MSRGHDEGGLAWNDYWRDASVRFYAEAHGTRSVRWRPYKRRSVLGASTMRDHSKDRYHRNLSWCRWQFSGPHHRFPFNNYFSVTVPMSIAMVPTNTAIAIPENNRPLINAVVIVMCL